MKAQRQTRNIRTDRRSSAVAERIPFPDERLHLFDGLEIPADSAPILWVLLCTRFLSQDEPERQGETCDDKVKDECACRECRRPLEDITRIQQTLHSLWGLAVPASWA